MTANLGPRPAFNPRAAMNVLTLGQEKNSVIVVDDALLNPQDFVDYAAKAEFGTPQGASYPGLNAPIPEGLALGAIAVLRSAFETIYGAPAHLDLAYSGYYGLVTTPPQNLSAYQAAPHFDLPNPQRLAIMIYLCGPEHGGTGFYRHRQTGFETVAHDRLATYIPALETELAQSDPQTGYYGVEGAHFISIGRVEARFNRLIVYHSHILHSGLVDTQRLSSDPRRGRLTANIFVEAAG